MNSRDVTGNFLAGSDPKDLKWYVQAELVHCRWAMLGAAGIFIPDALTKAGILNTPPWYTAGDATYFADQGTLFIIELILMGWAEGRRWADIIKPGSVNVDPIFTNNKLTGTDVGYPGGLWFDPLGWSKGSPEKQKDLRTREIKNGRLAMVAVLGAFVQASLTHTGPINNLLTHLADPSHNTILGLSTVSCCSQLQVYQSRHLVSWLACGFVDFLVVPCFVAASWSWAWLSLHLAFYTEMRRVLCYLIRCWERSCGIICYLRDSHHIVWHGWDAAC